jgi:hypothetical protein
MADDATRGRVHRFLRGEAHDANGRLLADTLAFDDQRIESVHDFVQWLFPLREASQAVPGSPVLGASEAAAIRADPLARQGLGAALDRMSRFYGETNGWLRSFDHNHLRITRIITAVGDLLGAAEAQAFHARIIDRNTAFGSPVNQTSLRYWRQALERNVVP